MLGSLKKKFRPEKGQVVVFTVLLLPLILGVVVFVIELGNIYVHYSDLQNIAENAALTGTAENARKVVEANSKNFIDKPQFKITITTYEGTSKNSTKPEKIFLVNLEKNMPPFFLKVFDKIRMLKVSAAVSEDGELLDIQQEYFNENFDWTIVPAPAEP